ncbi:uncharacterized protein LY79DRAFT_353431 [Colletotrichum navitas]|uniref:Uncharacterized protein n=1 Tax=Colletotrichum navitas TaxID=681940 RepID=A0AAD8Q809_9PEZI|nr:uncharacterized protein LY79DRAFT_353431 [Colletotrichum navitas]KAK1597691.1 hypothetical protein LY79DRAFT_353431 [Colletotrichum navitas]
MDEPPLREGSEADRPTLPRLFHRGHHQASTTRARSSLPSPFLNTKVETCIALPCAHPITHMEEKEPQSTGQGFDSFASRGVTSEGGGVSSPSEGEPLFYKLTTHPYPLWPRRFLTTRLLPPENQPPGCRNVGPGEQNNSNKRAKAVSVQPIPYQHIWAMYILRSPPPAIPSSRAATITGSANDKKNKKRQPWCPLIPARVCVSLSMKEKQTNGGENGKCPLHTHMEREEKEKCKKKKEQQTFLNDRKTRKSSGKAKAPPTVEQDPPPPFPHTGPHRFPLSSVFFFFLFPHN